MDLETENRIAAILLKEAAELKRQADREGVHAYLQKPKATGRPNSRFLTATVLGVQQANRAVEVNEMWRVRQKEQELNDNLKRRSKDDSRHSRDMDVSTPHKSTSRRHESNSNASCSSSKAVAESSYSREDEGLREEEVEEFLQSRVKRGRGSIGSRMDETGPYLPKNSNSPGKLSTFSIAREHCVMLGPEKPSSLKANETSSDEELHEHKQKKRKDHSRKHKSKEKSRDKKTRKDEKRSKRRN